MRQPKKNILLVIIIVFTSPLLSMVNLAEAVTLPFNNIVFFGDSLSDDGNLSNYDYGFLPQSPPYWNGRFSNGPTWAELTAKNFYNMDGITSANYAVGGSTAVWHNPLDGYMPYTLSFQVNDYLARNIFYSKAQTLFVIWIGTDDYLLTASNVNRATTKVVKSIKTQIKRLMWYGATNFVVVNLPDISRSPSARDRGVSRNLHALVMTHNAKLKQMLDELQTKYPNIKIVQIDAFTPFNQLLTNPQPFDQKYRVNIVNVTQPCWNGSYSYTNPTADQIKMQLSQLNSDLPQTNNKQTLDINQLLAAMKNSPSLQEAYMVGQSYSEGGTACANPNNHLFWDHIHPTEAGHTIIAAIMTQDIINAEQQ